jgi:hypothetical protein
MAVIPHHLARLASPRQVRGQAWTHPALAPLPIAPGIVVHSIISVKGDGPAESGNDGVVDYSSAHLPEAVSELVVRSGHPDQSNPQTIAEVRRILLLHLKESCAAGIRCASDAAAALHGGQSNGPT